LKDYNRILLEIKDTRQLLKELGIPVRKNDVLSELSHDMRFVAGKNRDTFLTDSKLGNLRKTFLSLASEVLGTTNEAYKE
jgi:hypothetical protein